MAGVAYAGAAALLTPSQAGDHLQNGERFIRRLIAARRIDHIALGRYVRVQRSWPPHRPRPGPRAPGARRPAGRTPSLLSA